VTGDMLHKLTAVIESRKGADAASSYVAKLLAKGEDAILKKVGEEAVEFVMAAKDATRDGSRDKVTAEATDLIFHLMVALAKYDLSLNDIERELARREGVSGITEKAARKE
jgi:phosphoribosyl-ATP pyrophosphohydrolase